MRSLLKFVSLVTLLFSLIACDQQTRIENRLERTEWKLVQKITTQRSFLIDEILRTTESVESFSNLLISFEDNGTGVIIHEIDGDKAFFSWSTSEGEENLIVNVVMEETLLDPNGNVSVDLNRDKTFTVILNDRDVQVWEAEPLRFPVNIDGSGMTILQKWELERP